MANVSERLERLKNGGEIKKEEKIPKKRGGVRPGSGRKPKESSAFERAFKARLDAHYGEDVKIEMTDPKTGRKFIVTKPRALRILEILYDIAVKDRSADAANKWLDRALGRPKQVQVIEGDEEKPILLKIDF